MKSALEKWKLEIADSRADLGNKYADHLSECIVDLADELKEARDALKIEHGPIDDRHGDCYACDALRKG